MIKRRFEYHAPASLDEAAELVAALDGETSIVSGGTWVVPEMTHGVRSPRHVVDLRRAGLDHVARDDGSLVLGTAATYARAVAADAAPAVLGAMVEGVTGGAQVHNQGTLGGSACYANPASDVPGFLVGLGATLRLARGGERRELDAAAFFAGAFHIALEPGELLAEIVLPLPTGGARAGYYKLKHCESSWPIATACCTIGGDGAVARLALGGVAAAPVLVEGAVGATDAATVEEAVRATPFEPWSDVLADGDYRRRVAPVVAKRAYAAATAR